MRIRSKISNKAYESNMTILELLVRTIMKSYNILLRDGEITMTEPSDESKVINS